MEMNEFENTNNESANLENKNLENVESNFDEGYSVNNDNIKKD